MNVKNKVINIISKILKYKVNIKTTRNNCPKWDSLKHLEIIMILEDEFEIQFKKKDLNTLGSIKILIKKIQDAT